MVGGNKKELLRIAAIAEKGSEHPLADAILNKASSMKLKLPDSQKFEAVPGMGISAVWNGKKIIVGNRKLVERHKLNISNLEEKIKELENKGKTVMIAAVSICPVAQLKPILIDDFIESTLLNIFETAIKWSAS